MSFTSNIFVYNKISYPTMKPKTTISTTTKKVYYFGRNFWGY